MDLGGANLGQLDGRIRALAALRKDQPSIREEDVSQLVGGDHAREVWDLIEAINTRNSALALKGFDRLLRDSPHSASGVLTLLARDFRRQAQARQMIRRKIPRAEIMRRLNLKFDFILDKILAAAGKLTLSDIQRRIKTILDAEIEIKTGVANDQWVVERTIITLCNDPAYARS